MRKQNLYTMEALIPVICSFFDEGKKVIIGAVGNSMRPLIRHKKDSIILEKYSGSALGIGDMAFYKRENGQYVLHRIVGIADDDSYIMMGDNQTVAETGITKQQIIAIPTAVIRGNKTVSVNLNRYRRYASFWAKSVFFRKLNIKLFALKIKIYRIFSGKKVSVD